MTKGLPIVYKGKIYFINNGCQEKGKLLDCTSSQFLEYSLDNGVTWEREIVPHRIKDSYFIIHNNILYHIYSTWCGNKNTKKNSLLPAVGYNCSQIYIRSLSEDNSWSKPQLLSSTADKLYGVYEYADSLLLIWLDNRLHKTRWCGFIPLIGYVDGEPTTGPFLLFAGLFNTEKKELSEFLIQKGYNYETILRYLPKY